MLGDTQGGQVLFLEKQYFRQPWLWLLLGGIAVINYWAFVQQIVLGEPWGDNPASDAALLVIVLVFGLLFPLLFLVAHLCVEVRTDLMKARFFPLHLRPRTFAREDIICHRLVTYRPLRDFGGWGIRYGSVGKAYNISGNRGVLLELRDGGTLLIGSRRAEELDAAMSLMRAAHRPEPSPE